MQKVEIEKRLLFLLDHQNIKYDGIPKIDFNSLTYVDFFEDYMHKNRPCIITNVGRNWKATKKWVCNGKPNLSYLRKNYGKFSVMVYDCDEKYFNSQKMEMMTVEDYINYWENRSEYSFKLKYLKDWHLRNKAPDDFFYEVPMPFASDWLNEYLCENLLDDYRFVYVGPKGTWTPFHADVFTSYSWSTNICGRKRWLLFPPGEEDNLRDRLNNLPYNIDKIPPEKTCFEIIQNVNEAIFVPSRWYHQVWNLEDTISINHNWINACNIKIVWMSLKETLKDVRNVISDCKDMDNFSGQCQMILKSTFGMDFLDFYKFISYVALKRINLFENGATVVISDGKILGTNHAKFDLIAIKNVLELFCNECDLCKLVEFKDHILSPKDLLNKIIMTLSVTEVT